MDRVEVRQLIAKERRYQMERWGLISHHTPAQWLAILTEEVGEVAREVLVLEGEARPNWKPCTKEEANKARSNITRELIQIAAVCHAWLENEF